MFQAFEYTWLQTASCKQVLSLNHYDISSAMSSDIALHNALNKQSFFAMLFFSSYFSVVSVLQTPGQFKLQQLMRKRLSTTDRSILFVTLDRSMICRRSYQRGFVGMRLSNVIFTKIQQFRRNFYGRPCFKGSFVKVPINVYIFSFDLPFKIFANKEKLKNISTQFVFLIILQLQ